MVRVTCLIPTLVAFLLTCNVMAMDPRNTNSKDVPWYGEIIPPEPSPGFYIRVLHCLWNLSPGCGLQVYHYIFNPSVQPDDDCCRIIISIGLKCNRLLGLALSAFKKFKPQEALINKQSKLVYHNCVRRNL